MSLTPPAIESTHQTDSRAPLSPNLVGTKSLSQSTYVDSILWGGKYWALAQDRTIHYSFLNNQSADLDDQAYDEAQNPNNWRSFEKQAVKNAFRAFSQIANVTFKQASDDNQAATLKLYNLTDQEADFDGAFGPPGERDQGFGYFNQGADGWNQTQIAPGTYAFNLLLHEIGHGLGLAHPHDSGGGSNLFPGVSPFASFDLGDNKQNQGIYTVMSYNDGNAKDQTQTDDLYGHATTLMPFDIAALQHLYGANTQHHQGNNSYRLPQVNQQGTFYSTIWDTGGIDTIYAGNIQRSARINLQAAPLIGPQAGGYLSQHAKIAGGFLIAYGVEIENAIAGKGNDRIVGNHLDNSLSGRMGHDRLIGKDGNDYILGQEGQDTLSGEQGNDTLDGGIGRDILFGGRGRDYLVGGSGSDRFRLGRLDKPDKIVDFVVQDDDKVQLIGQNFSTELQAGLLPGSHFTVGAQAVDHTDRLIYNQDQGLLYFDGDGVGGDRQMLIARMSPRLALTHHHFEII